MSHLVHTLWQESRGSLYYCLASKCCAALTWTPFARISSETVYIVQPSPGSQFAHSESFFNPGNAWIRISYIGGPTVQIEHKSMRISRFYRSSCPISKVTPSAGLRIYRASLLHRRPGAPHVSGVVLSGTQNSHEEIIDYRSILKDNNAPLRLLVENEIFRLSVWTNPLNDPKRGADYGGAVERLMTDVRFPNHDIFILALISAQPTWVGTVRKIWHVHPAVAISMAERFHSPAVQNEVTRLVRSNTRDVLDVPEALHSLVGEWMGTQVKRDLKVRSLCDPR